ncbi:Ketohexokinase [Triangularia verruculosa]|uniref:Ketohexokinase n=1 Tax=Triangularia verruculosa TaxID=2587418 RepID=A0AAN6XIL0_9PEZI|nr:Ketohexokinase [Triangularia verruculosa]
MEHDDNDDIDWLDLVASRPCSVTPSESASQVHPRRSPPAPFGGSAGSNGNGNNRSDKNRRSVLSSHSSSLRPIQEEEVRLFATTQSQLREATTRQGQRSSSKLPPIPDFHESASNPLVRSDDHLISLTDAIERTRDCKARLATTHEGWLLAAKALIRAGLVPANPEMSSDLKQFGDGICERYAAATFLWNTLQGSNPAEWLAKGKCFDASLRRIKTLRGLEGSLRLWEGITLRLLELVDRDFERIRRREREIGEVLGRWRRGMPTKP